MVPFIKDITIIIWSSPIIKISDAEFIPNEDETMEIEIIPQKKIRVSRDHETEEQFSLGNLQLQFGRKLEYLEEEIKNKPEIVTNVDLCKGQRSPNSFVLVPSRPREDGGIRRTNGSEIPNESNGRCF